MRLIVLECLKIYEETVIADVQYIQFNGVFTLNDTDTDNISKEAIVICFGVWPCVNTSTQFYTSHFYRSGCRVV